MKKIKYLCLIILTLICIFTSTQRVHAENGELELNTEVLNDQNNIDSQSSGDDSKLFTNDFMKQNQNREKELKQNEQKINNKILGEHQQIVDKDEIIDKKIFTSEVSTNTTSQNEQQNYDLYIIIATLIISLIVTITTYKYYKNKGKKNENKNKYTNK